LGLADLQEADWRGKLLLVGPHLAGAALTALFGPWRVWAGMVALSGTALMAGLSWWDTLTRRTEGFEWPFSNALGGMLCCGATWLVLAVVGCIVPVIMSAPGQEPDLGASSRDQGSGGAEEEAATDGPAE
jgi:hypothetical protein